MNELVMGMLPLDQWKNEALEEILPPYVTLLRGLVMRLRGEAGRACLPLFLCQRPKRRSTNKAMAKAAQDNVDKNEDSNTETYLPILYAAVQIFTSPLFGTSLRDSEGCLIRTTAMNVILNLCRITDGDVRDVLVQGVTVVGSGGDGSGSSSSSVAEANKKESLPTTKSVPYAKMPPSWMASHPMTMEQELLFPHVCNSLNQSRSQSTTQGNRLRILLQTSILARVH